MRLPILVAVLASGYLSSHCLAQGVRQTVPYSGQLRTDPAVGNIQGIQRYGRPLKTDPDEGEGFSYYVYPVAENPILVGGDSRFGNGFGYRSSGLPAIDTGARLRSATVGSDQDPGVLTLRRQMNALAELVNDPATDPASIPALQVKINDLEKKIAGKKEVAVENLLELVQQGASIETSAFTSQSFGSGQAPASPYPPPFDWTDGIRKYPIPEAARTPFGNAPIEARAKVFKPAVGTSAAQLIDVYHQPLIQIKLRVIEVVRNDDLAVNSVLEYVSHQNTKTSLTSGNPLNSAGGIGFRNTRGLTRFALPDLISNSTTGSGMLVNLTKEHINWLASFLATELKGDIVTAPEVVTLNGQNVEFVSGAKVPFALGQVVTTGSTTNTQQVFYKHVGTMVSVTPTIVNWGFYGEGSGEAAIVASEIADWNAMAEFITSNGLASEDLKALLMVYQDSRRPVPFDLKSSMLKALNAYTRSDIQRLTTLVEDGLVSSSACERCRRWKPEDCTVDMSVVVRLSTAGEAAVSLSPGADLTNVSTEGNVRAVANVIQVKSGHGVVMAGLIGERELEQTSKVPVLGDVPVVGALFRSRFTQRFKTEVLVFIEAQVLDRDPNIARCDAAHDFVLGQAYVSGDLLDNPLETGLYRVGIGTYLPPHSHEEEVFWERFGRSVRRIKTHIDDVTK